MSELAKLQKKITQLKKRHKEALARRERTIDRLRGHCRELSARVSTLTAENMVLKNRNNKSEELRQVFEPPETKTVKSFEIDNRS